MEFTEDAKSLGLTINTSQTPSDSYVLKLQSSPLQYGRARKMDLL